MQVERPVGHRRGTGCQQLVPEITTTQTRPLMDLCEATVDRLELDKINIASSADHVPVNLILFTDDGCASLLVDDVGEVLEVDEDNSNLRLRPCKDARGS